jgi:hypothetical protein
MTPGNADGFCGSSDPAVLICSGVWGLLSFVVLIAWLRWEDDQSSASDAPNAKLLAQSPEVLPRDQISGPDFDQQ